LEVEPVRNKKSVRNPHWKCWGGSWARRGKGHDRKEGRRGGRWWVGQARQSTAKGGLKHIASRRARKFPITEAERRAENEKVEKSSILGSPKWRGKKYNGSHPNRRRGLWQLGGMKKDLWAYKKGKLKNGKDRKPGQKHICRLGEGKKREGGGGGATSMRGMSMQGMMKGKKIWGGGRERSEDLPRAAQLGEDAPWEVRKKAVNQRNDVWKGLGKKFVGTPVRAKGSVWGNCEL